MKLFSVQECSFRKRVRPLSELEEWMGSGVILAGTRGLIKQSGYVNCRIYTYRVQVPETPCRLFIDGSSLHVLERSLALES